MKKTCLILSLIMLMAASVALATDIPKMMNYQGYVETTSGTALNGDGYFKFSIIDDPTSPTTTYWCNDCSGSSAGVTEPTTSETVTVTNGVFTVKLGAAGMSALTETVFQNQNVYIRVWFSDDNSTFEQMSPDTQIVSSAFAYKAQTVAANAISSSAIVDGSITSADIDSTNLDSDTLDGFNSTDFSAFSHTHSGGGGGSCDQTCIDDFESRIVALEQILLTHFSRTGNDIYINGANLHVESGTGTTDGAVNGLGNIIVGYDESRGVGSAKTGSHNVIVGKNHNYSSYGGIVVGFQNTISGTYSSVSGGQFNIASGLTASVSGGNGNVASGESTHVGGGASNIASGATASLSGGIFNIASGVGAHVSGGGGFSSTDGNVAFSDLSAILGGSENIAGDPTLTDNTVGRTSTVSGGKTNIASGLNASVSGGLTNTASGQESSVSGGESNTASGDKSSVSGGSSRAATGTHDWSAGTLNEDL